MSRGRSLGSTPVWVIVLLGGALTAVGVLVQIRGTTPIEQLIAATVAALGAGILGAGVSIYLAAGEGRDTLLAVRELVAGSISAKMTSSDHDLAIVRKAWHFYHLTQRDHRYVWRYTDYRLDTSNAVGTVVTVVNDQSFGAEHLFRAEVAMRGDRMILVEEDLEERIPSMIAVTPNFHANYKKVRGGVVLVQSWDGTNLLSKCIWSLYELVPATSDGDVAPADGARLERIWQEEFRTTNVILPSATDKVANLPEWGNATTSREGEVVEVEPTLTVDGTLRAPEPEA